MIEPGGHPFFGSCGSTSATSDHEHCLGIP